MKVHIARLYYLFSPLFAMQLKVMRFSAEEKTLQQNLYE